MKPAVVVSLDARFVSLSVCVFFYEQFSGHFWYRHDGGDRHMDGDSLLVGVQVKKAPLLQPEVTIKEKQLFTGTGSGQTNFLQS